MSDPLSPFRSSMFNMRSSPLKNQHLNLESLKLPHSHPDTDENNDPPSSPFVPVPTQDENVPPSDWKSSVKSFDSAKSNSRPASPLKQRSPLKDNSPLKNSPSKIKIQSLITEEALRDNEGLTRAISTMMKENKAPHYSIHEDDDVDEPTICYGDDTTGYAGMDDTAFSTFSAVPNVDMTAFAGRFQQDTQRLSSPEKQLRSESYSRQDDAAKYSYHNGIRTPRTERRGVDYMTSSSPTPTPRRHKPSQSFEDTTNLILDFTEQFNAFSTSQQNQRSPPRRSPTRSPTTKNLAAHCSRNRTPSPSKRSNGIPSTPSQRNLANLLDFDIPPAPTPRSMPLITPRELESLKSDFLSQISSLKATLSGREAEVASLKSAVEDAERRVGEAQETIREERGAKEAAKAGLEDWEKRGKEMESVLRSVKDEIVSFQHEKDELGQKLDYAERKREEAEGKVAEAESRSAGMMVASATAANVSSETSRDMAKEVEAAVEKVARELHALYKSKHETKVSALKKSYESRWEKRVRELETKIEDITKENEDLKLVKDSTLSGVVQPHVVTTEQEQKRQKDREEERVQEAARFKELKAELAGVQSQLSSIESDNSSLRKHLEQERVEKGELVAAVEEMLSIQAAHQAGDHEAANAGIENLRGSISRASGAAAGIKQPGFGSSVGGPNVGFSESRIGRVSAPTGHGRSRSGSSNGMGRSIMSNIERMGRGRSD